MVFVAQAMALSALPAAVPGLATSTCWVTGLAIAMVFLLAHKLAWTVLDRLAR